MLHLSGCLWEQVGPGDVNQDVIGLGHATVEDNVVPTLECGTVRIIQAGYWATPLQFTLLRTTADLPSTQ